MIEFNDELARRIVDLQMQVRDDSDRLDAAEAKVEELMSDPDKYEEYFGEGDCS